jgi:hypothetical protein
MNTAIQNIITDPQEQASDSMTPSSDLSNHVLRYMKQPHETECKAVRIQAWQCVSLLNGYLSKDMESNSCSMFDRNPQKSG